MIFFILFSKHRNAMELIGIQCEFNANSTDLHFGEAPDARAALRGSISTSKTPLSRTSRLLVRVRLCLQHRRAVRGAEAIRVTDLTAQPAILVKSTLNLLPLEDSPALEVGLVLAG